MINHLIKDARVKYNRKHGEREVVVLYGLMNFCEGHHRSHFFYNTWQCSPYVNVNSLSAGSHGHSTRRAVSGLSQSNEEMRCNYNTVIL